MGTSLVSSMGSTCPYDIGDILQTTNSKNPSERWNGTEWTQINGKFLLGTDDNHTIGSTGGEFEHKLAISEIPNHDHSTAKGGRTENEALQMMDKYQTYQSEYNIAPSKYWAAHTLPTGGGKPHNNTPLFGSVYLAKNSIKAVLCKVVKL